jgi:hypothetical protein
MNSASTANGLLLSSLSLTDDGMYADGPTVSSPFPFHGDLY